MRKVLVPAGLFSLVPCCGRQDRELPLNPDVSLQFENTTFQLFFRVEKLKNVFRVFVSLGHVLRQSRNGSMVSMLQYGKFGAVCPQEDRF